MAFYDKRTWDVDFLQSVLSDNGKTIKHINAIKSCIEADESAYLLKIIGTNYKARIYSLIRCFTFIPSVRCIETLIAEGTPLDETFENNPFKCTPQEYLDKYFPTSNIMEGPQYNCLSRDRIYEAIQRGKMVMKNKEPAIRVKSSSVKKLRRSLLSLINKNLDQ